MIRVRNCRIRRLTLGTLPSAQEELTSTLAEIAEGTGDCDSEDFPLYTWLEDLDNILYLDGPVFDEDIVIESDSNHIKLSTLIGLGASTKVVGEIHVDSTADSLLAWSDMVSEGELSYLQACGDQDELEVFLGKPVDESSKSLRDLAQQLVILIKVWHTPLGAFQMFVGLAYKAFGEVDYKDHWGDGSYESDVKSSEAGIMSRSSDGKWENWTFERLEKIVETVCEECD